LDYMVTIDDYQNNSNILRIKSMVYETFFTHYDPPDRTSDPDRQ
jgi:hypothetical protein